jgi:hypothetical protein
MRSTVMCNLCQVNYNDEVKEDEMCRACRCSTNGVEEEHV